IPPQPSTPLLPYTTLFRSYPWCPLSRATKEVTQFSCADFSIDHVSACCTGGKCRKVERYMPRDTGSMMTSTTSWVQIMPYSPTRSEEHTSELQSRFDLVCR